MTNPHRKHYSQLLISLRITSKSFVYKIEYMFDTSPGSLYKRLIRSDANAGENLYSIPSIRNQSSCIKSYICGLFNRAQNPSAGFISFILNVCIYAVYLCIYLCIYIFSATDSSSSSSNSSSGACNGRHLFV